MSRRKPRHEAHVRLYRHELDSEAYRSLSPEARALLVEFRALYGGGDNRVYMSRREMQRRLGVGRMRAEKARDDLADRGFIRLLTKGTFTRKARHASEYALTNEPINNGMGATAPKDYMRWRQKNTGLISNHVGVDDQPRGHETKPRKCAHGVDEQPRKGSKPTTLGVDDQPTDTAATVGGNDWLAQYGGWPCRNKSVLNTCCLVCGVWITSSRYEFDGAKHSCDPVSRAKYEARLQRTTDEQAAA